MARLSGALAAAVTPLRDEGTALDEDAFAPLMAFLAGGGLDGILALGTTGEGIMLSAAERQRAAELFVAARPAGFAVAVHCGAQTTAETVALAAHAAEAGADAVAVIGPPYFAFDELSLLRHFAAAAAACAPLPFYVYEFAARSGYPIPVSVIERLSRQAANLCGLKVSDSPIAAVEPYHPGGWTRLLGLEPLVLEGMERGAVGAVSGLATAFPEVVAELVHERTQGAHEVVLMLRERLQSMPFHAALKAIVAARDVPVREDVRPPLRGLTAVERAETLAILDDPAVTGRR